MTKFAHPLGQRGCRHAFNGRLRGRVNVQQINGVRLVEALGEIIHQSLRACVAVRLENYVDAAIVTQTCCRQGSSDFSRMMAIIVDYGYSPLLAAHLKPAIDPGETSQ